jgi:hypothetical protein
VECKLNWPTRVSGAGGVIEKGGSRQRRGVKLRVDDAKDEAKHGYGCDGR